MKINFSYCDDVYFIDITKDTITVSENGTAKTLPLIQHHFDYEYDYVYQVRKTRVHCKDASSLYKHFRYCIENNFSVHFYCVLFVQNILGRV